MMPIAQAKMITHMRFTAAALTRRTAAAASRLSSSSAPATPPARPARFVPPQQGAPPAQQRMLLPKKKKTATQRSRRPQGEASSSHVTAHVMANKHDTLSLADFLRARFGAGAVQVFGGATEGSLVPGEVGLIEGVIHLSAPSSGNPLPQGRPDQK